MNTLKMGRGGQEVLDGVSEDIIEFHGSYLTNFVKGSSPRNGSKYVKTGGRPYAPQLGLWRTGGS